MSTVTWTGNGVGSNWLTLGNWNGVIPIIGDDIVFPAAMNTHPANNLVNGLGLRSLSLTGSGYDLSGNGILLGSGGVTNAINSGTNSINIPLILSGTTTIANTGTAGVLNLGSSIMSGSNTLNLAGGAGGTNVLGALVGSGTLNLGGKVTLGNDPSLFLGPVSVNSGTTLIRADYGRNIVSVAAGAVLAGDGIVGALNLGGTGSTLQLGQLAGAAANLQSGNLTMAAGSILSAVIGNAVGTLNVRGTVNLANTTLNAVYDGAASLNPGQVLTLINNDGADAVIGAFNGLAEGALVTLSSTLTGVSKLFRISYHGGDGNDVTLTLARPGQLNFSSATFSTGEGAGSATITITRSQGADGPATVHFATQDGSGLGGLDFSHVVTTVTFADGETTKTVSIPLIDDSAIEPLETVNLAISSAIGATLGDMTSSILTIRDNDSAISFASPGGTIDDSAGTAHVIVNRVGDLTSATTVNYATTDGTAVAGRDFTAASGTLAFAPGESSHTIDVPVTSGQGSATGRTLSIALTSAAGSQLGAISTYALTITHVDPAESSTNPTITVSDTRVSPAANDLGVANFTVRLSAASTSTISVNYATANGTATAGIDYVAAAGTMVFLPGETAKTVSVNVVGTQLEAPETFTLGLSTPVNAALSAGGDLATCTIVPASDSNNSDGTLIAKNIDVVVAQSKSVVIPVLSNLPGKYILSLAGNVSSLPTEKGTVTILDNGTADLGDDSLRFTADANVAGPVRFSYTLTDDRGASATGEVTVWIDGVGAQANANDPSRTDIVIGGTGGDDSVQLIARTLGKIEVIVNGESRGVFDQPTGWFVVATGPGNDVIDLSKMKKARPVLTETGSGNDTVYGSPGVDFIYGEDGNDVLDGGAGSNAIIGGAGNDDLIGGRGRGILIGGAGADILRGGKLRDILVGGATYYDDAAPANEATISQLLREWVKPAPYASLVTSFTSTGGINGSHARFAADTVTDDRAADVLSGKGGQDLFFVNKNASASELVDRTATETAILI